MTMTVVTPPMDSTQNSRIFNNNLPGSPAIGSRHCLDTDRCDTPRSPVPLSGLLKNNVRNVSLSDLIDEEFVVNCGAPCSGKRCGTEGRMRRRNSCESDYYTSRPIARRRKSILDMMDGIAAPDTANKTDSLVMTTRSYPRGVHFAPPKEQATAGKGNTIAFVSSEAYNQW